MTTAATRKVVIDGEERTEHAVNCGECGVAMRLRPSRFGLFYGCSTFPTCKGTHGAHPDGAPLGVPANKETREARIRAHAVFDRLWQGPKPPMESRAKAYKWLADKLGRIEVHIGELSVEECVKVEKLAEARFRLG